MKGVRFFYPSICLVSCLLALARADVIECDNGDRYNGKVLSMDEQQVKLQNDIAGTLTIPRNRIVSISFRPLQKTALRTAGSTNSLAGRSAAVPGRGLQIDDGSIEKVQQELLSTANPEANQMFQEMVRGLQSGQLNLGDIRSKAQDTLKELRKLQGELGDDETAGLLDSYATILESFVRQAPAATNRPAPRPSAPSGPAKP